MLKKIADYLLNEKKWSEENINGVVFHDIDNNDHEKIIHHFRSSTLKEESKYLEKSWEQCLQDMHNKIPAFKIKVHNGDASEIIYLKTLNILQMKYHSQKTNQFTQMILRMYH